ncbi:MAG: TonB-dependent receptor [Bacteroidales bacterium]|nr:TonB-dependent receptor [Bacteroidales bacterium]
MRIKILLWITAVCLLFPVLSRAQSRVSVSGRIVDDEGQPVPGAAVVVKGNPALGGAVTSTTGEYTLTVPQGSVLEVTCIGFSPQEKRFTGNSVWDITLVPDAEVLEDVVVVGYGTQKKESVVGAISQVGTDALTRSGTLNITNALAGKLSGVVTYQSSGQPGNDDATIFIRGLSSWNGSSPLVMVDGVERQFSSLNPDEVKTISVLKDASATAVFGARGANGVILVTTKTGSKGAPKMNLSVNYGVNIPEELPQYIPAAKVLEMANVAMRNEQSFGSVYSPEDIEAYRSRVNPVRYPDNDWFGMLLNKVSQTFNATYNISGGTDKVRYYVGVGYTTDGSIVKRINDWSNSDFRYHKMNYRANLDINLTKSTLLSVKVGGVTDIEQHPDGVTVASLFTTMYNASPVMFPAYYPKETMYDIPDWEWPGLWEDRLAQTGTSYAKNPYTLLAQGNYTQTTRNRLNTDLQLSQDLDFITKGLSVKGMVSLTSVFSRYSQQGVQNIPVYRIDWEAFDYGAQNPWSSTEKGNEVYVQPPYSVSVDNTARSTTMVLYWEASLNYARKFAKKHNVTALALMNQRQRLAGASFPHRQQAFVSRVTYDYKGKYLFEANMGITGSEQFAPRNRYGYFPSAAVGYYISKENFWKKAMPWWSTMKIRYSDGLVGSDEASSDWLYYSSYSKNKNRTIILEDLAANETARWETAHKRDVGVEMGFLKDMFTVSVDLFDESRKDMLVTPTESPLSGVSSKDVNTGRMEKHGIDIEAKWRMTTARGFYYEAGFMLGLNENRILSYEEPVGTPSYQKYVGTSYQAARTGMNLIDGNYFGSVDELHGYPNALGEVSGLYPGIYKLLDFKVDGAINSLDMHAIRGIAYPPMVGSFNLGFGYKGLSVNILFYGTHGKYVNFNRAFWKEFIKQDVTVHAAQLDYWRPDNPGAGHSTLSFDDKLYSMLGGSANDTFDMLIEGHSWRKSDYLTLKELYVSYKFDGNRLRQLLGVRGLSVTLTGNNLFTATSLIEGNPQRTALSSSYYPIMRTVRLGVKLDF